MNITFDGNTFTNTGLNGTDQIKVRESNGTTTFNGTVNNIIGPAAPGFLRLKSDGAPSGTVIINGASVVLPVNVP
jgi:hypothetical protein